VVALPIKSRRLCHQVTQFDLELENRVEHICSCCGPADGEGLSRLAFGTVKLARQPPERVNMPTNTLEHHNAPLSSGGFSQPY